MIYRDRVAPAVRSAMYPPYEQRRRMNRTGCEGRARRL